MRAFQRGGSGSAPAQSDLPVLGTCVISRAQALRLCLGFTVVAGALGVASAATASADTADTTPTAAPSSWTLTIPTKTIEVGADGSTHTYVAPTSEPPRRPMPTTGWTTQNWGDKTLPAAPSTPAARRTAAPRTPVTRRTTRHTTAHMAAPAKKAEPTHRVTPTKRTEPAAPPPPPIKAAPVKPAPAAPVKAAPASSPVVHIAPPNITPKLYRSWRQGSATRKTVAVGSTVTVSVPWINVRDRDNTNQVVGQLVQGSRNTVLWAQKGCPWVLVTAGKSQQVWVTTYALNA